MAAVARIASATAKIFASAGYEGRINRRNPYAPSLRRTPARSMEPAVGASEWADRHFDREGDRKRPEGDRLDCRNRHPKECGAWVEGIPFLVECEQIVGPEQHAKHLNGQEQPERSTHRVDHELERSVIAIGA